MPRKKIHRHTVKADHMAEQIEESAREEGRYKGPGTRGCLGDCAQGDAQSSQEDNTHSQSRKTGLTGHFLPGGYVERR
jgi:hypothetical protein